MIPFFCAIFHQKKSPMRDYDPVYSNNHSSNNKKIINQQIATATILVPPCSINAFLLVQSIFLIFRLAHQR